MFCLLSAGVTSTERSASAYFRPPWIVTQPASQSPGIHRNLLNGPPCLQCVWITRLLYMCARFLDSCRIVWTSCRSWSDDIAHRHQARQGCPSCAAVFLIVLSPFRTTLRVVMHPLRGFRLMMDIEQHARSIQSDKRDSRREPNCLVLSSTVVSSDCDIGLSVLIIHGDTIMAQ